jgi:hypothetical protein
MNRYDKDGHFTDYLANEANDQEPILSNIGRGQRGSGLDILPDSVVKGDDVFKFTITEDEWGRVVLESGNLSAGKWTLEQLDSSHINFILTKEGLPDLIETIELPTRGGARSCVVKPNVDWPFVRPTPEEYSTADELTHPLHFDFNIEDLEWQQRPPKIGDLMFMRYTDTHNTNYMRYGFILGYVNDITWVGVTPPDTDYYELRQVAPLGISVVGIKVFPFLTDSLIDYIDEMIKERISSTLKFIGYVSTTDPAPLDPGIKVGYLWHNSSDMTDAFPWTVKQWNGSTWDVVPDYEPSAMDLWSNMNTTPEHEGFYWFSGEWNRNDFYADNVTVEVIDGKLSVINVPWGIISNLPAFSEFKDIEISSGANPTITKTMMDGTTSEVTFNPESRVVIETTDVSPTEKTLDINLTGLVESGSINGGAAVLPDANGNLDLYVTFPPDEKGVETITVDGVQPPIAPDTNGNVDLQISKSNLVSEDLSSQLDGTSRTFTITTTVVSPGEMVVFANGIKLRYGQDYTVSGQTLTMRPQMAPLGVDDTLEVWLVAAAPGGGGGGGGDSIIGGLVEEVYPGLKNALSAPIIIGVRKDGGNPDEWNIEWVHNGIDTDITGVRVFSTNRNFDNTFEYNVLNWTMNTIHIFDPNGDFDTRQYIYILKEEAFRDVYSPLYGNLDLSMPLSLGLGGTGTDQITFDMIDGLIASGASANNRLVTKDDIQLFTQTEPGLILGNDTVAGAIHADGTGVGRVNGWSGVEQTANKLTAIDPNATDDEYFSAKAMVDAFTQFAVDVGASAVPRGGATGTILTKNSADDYNMSWQAPALASDLSDGTITAAMYTQINADHSIISSLSNVGGTWIGQNFNTKADLDAFTFATGDGIVEGDYTYVLDDEDHDDHLTMYRVTGTDTSRAWNYMFVVQEDPVAFFENDVAGTIVGSGSTGKVYAEADGTGSVNGFDQLQRIDNMVQAVDASSTDDKYPSAKCLWDTANQVTNAAIANISLPGTATEITEGLVLSSPNNAKIQVESDGTMTLNGYDELENIDNKVTTIDDMSDDDTYPSAKAVYDFVGANISNAIERIYQPNSTTVIIRTEQDIDDMQAQLAAWIDVRDYETGYMLDINVTGSNPYDIELDDGTGTPVDFPDAFTVYLRKEPH